MREIHPLDNLPATHRDSERAYYARVGALIDHVPQPLRDIRIHQASATCLHICADRHRMRMIGSTVPPFAVHISQLLDTLVAQLATPPSAETLATLEKAAAHPSAGAVGDRDESRTARRPARAVSSPRSRGPAGG
ncbi:hypothetical protein [Nocardia sp. NPDC003963]